MQKHSTDLLDAEVWLALVTESHAGHARALQYWETQTQAMAAFCRCTQLSLLQKLTDPVVMGESVLTPVVAWTKLEELLSLPEVGFLDEPPMIDQALAQCAREAIAEFGLGTEIYLAAFASVARARLVTFDPRCKRFGGGEVLVL